MHLKQHVGIYFIFSLEDRYIVRYDNVRFDINIEPKIPVFDIYRIPVPSPNGYLSFRHCRANVIEALLSDATEKYFSSTEIVAKI